MLTIEKSVEKVRRLIRKPEKNFLDGDIYVTQYENEFHVEFFADANDGYWFFFAATLNAKKQPTELHRFDLGCKWKMLASYKDLCSSIVLFELIAEIVELYGLRTSSLKTINVNVRELPIFNEEKDSDDETA